MRKWIEQYRPNAKKNVTMALLVGVIIEYRKELRYVQIHTHAAHSDFAKHSKQTLNHHEVSDGLYDDGYPNECPGDMVARTDEVCCCSLQYTCIIAVQPLVLELFVNDISMARSNRLKPVPECDIGEDGRAVRYCERFTLGMITKTTFSDKCCKYPLDIVFKDIGYDWILVPNRYTAYYCAGHCHAYESQRSMNSVIVSS